MIIRLLFKKYLVPLFVLILLLSGVAYGATLLEIQALMKDLQDAGNAFKAKSAYHTTSLALHVKESKEKLSHAFTMYESDKVYSSVVRSTFDELINAFFGAHQTAVTLQNEATAIANQFELSATKIADPMIVAVYTGALPEYKVAEATFQYLAQSLEANLQSMSILQTIATGASAATMGGSENVNKLTDLIVDVAVPAATSALIGFLQQLSQPPSIQQVVQSEFIAIVGESIQSKIKNTASLEGKEILENSTICQYASFGACDSALTIAKKHVALIQQNSEYQQKLYAYVSSATFAASFGVTINNVVADAIYKNKALLESGANTLIQSIIQQTYPGGTIEEAYAQALMMHSHLMTNHDINRNLKIDLQDIIFGLQMMAN